MDSDLGAVAFAGMAAGFAKTFISHPLDTVKVHIQTARPPPRSVNGLFRGVSVPLVRNGIEHSMHFFLRNVVATGLVAVGIPGSENPWLVGFLAGVPQSLVNCPMDYTRLTLQLGNKFKFRSVYRGLPWVIMKESCSGMAFFGMYEGLKSLGLVPGAAGSAAALSAMISTYPMDTIKNRVQGGSSLTQATKMKSFSSGMPWAIGKCVVANFVALTMYEYALEHSKKRNVRAREAAKAKAKDVAAGPGGGAVAREGLGAMPRLPQRKKGVELATLAASK